jgi:hypothetical protein
MRPSLSVTTPFTAKLRTTSKAADLSSLGQLLAGAALSAAPALSSSAAVLRTAALGFVVVTLAACEAPPPAKWALAPDTANIHCLNIYNSAPWDIVLDRAHGRADGQAADFGPRHIHWTATGASYDLDVATGALTVGRGSSTGGWVSNFTCAPLARA